MAGDCVKPTEEEEGEADSGFGCCVQYVVQYIILGLLIKCKNFP